MACPSVFSFAYYSAPSTLARCAFSGACPVSGGQYTIPLMDQGAVTGCGTGSCPDAFLVPAAAAGGSPVTCLTTRSRCSSVSGNFVFSLFRAGPPAVLGGIPTPTLERCIPSPAGITTCSSITYYTGLELYNSLGALVGCTTSSVTTCPTQFPIALYNAAGGLISCRANLTGSCGAATGKQFPTQIFDDRVSNVLGTAAQPHASFSFCNYVSSDMPRSVLGYIRVVHCVAVAVLVSVGSCGLCVGRRLRPVPTQHTSPS
jgi:hypothetical protein